MPDARPKWWKSTALRTAFVGFAVLVLLGLVAWWYQKGLDSPAGFVSGFYGGLVAAGAAGLAALIAWIQLKSLADTALNDSARDAARFALHLKTDFFTDKTRTLVELINEDWLIYKNAKEDGTPLPHTYFTIDSLRINASSLPEKLRERLTKQTDFSCFEIDDLLLGHFEDLYSLWKRKLLPLSLIYEGFSWYIEQCANNCAIRRYIADESRESPDVWDGFLKLADVLKNYDPDDDEN